MGTKARKPTAATTGEEPAVHEGAELPERWSVQRKTELVLRLLRGEALDAVSRESQIPAHELEGWKRVFLETGARGLKTRAEPEERLSSVPSRSTRRALGRSLGRATPVHGSRGRETYRRASPLRPRGADNAMRSVRW